MAAPLRCGLGCRSRTDGRIRRSWFYWIISWICLTYTWDITDWVISSRYPRQMTSTKFRYQSRYRLGVVYTCNIRRRYLEDITQVGISQVYDNYIPCITCHLPCIILYMSGCLQKKYKSTELNMHIYTIQYEKLQSGICMTYTTM